MLWPDEAESTARGNLRRHLHDLRRALPTAPDTLPWIVNDGGFVQWNPAAPWWLDVDAFEMLSDQGNLADATALYAGDLLPTLYEDWIFFERERLRNLFFGNMQTLIQEERHRHNFAQAIAYAKQILHHDSMREDVVRELMTLRHENGDRTGALLEYQRFERRLREELDVPPMIETRALYDALARQVTVRAPVPDPAAAIETPGRKSEQTDPVAPKERRAPSNLPAQFSTFIGRAEELSAVRNLLTSSVMGVRLLTLTGAGGCGKTRLALEAAHRLHQEEKNHFPGGIYFVSLENLSDPALLSQVIAQALGIHDSAGHSALDNLKDALHMLPMLLILDNFEHVLTAAPLVTELLRAAPGLRFLITSRTVLRIYGEQEFPIPPMPLPTAEDVEDLDRLSQCESVALFVTRSRTVNPNFMLHRKNAAAIADICLRLDGLPLALELAAARSKFFTPAALLERLQDRLGFLAERGRVQSERHQTLRATLDWSYNLLNEGEKRLFAYFSIFGSAFSLDAATALCSDCDEWDVLTTVESLVNNSLLQQQLFDESDDSSGPGEGESMFRMLATVRDYALERLAERDDAAAVRRRFIEYYVAFAEAASVQLKGREQATCLRRFEREHENLRAALRYCQEPSPTVSEEEALLGLRLAAHLGIFWFTVGYFAEGERWLSAALAQAPDLPDALHAKAFYALSAMLHGQGELRRALALVEQSLALYRRRGDQAGIADALYSLGRLLNRQKSYDQARRALDESLTISQRLGYDYRIAYVYNILAGIHLAMDEFDEAEAVYQEALAAARRSQDRLGIAFILTSMGELARLRNDFARAEEYYQEAMTLAQQSQQKSRIVMLLHNLAHVALHHGQLRKATVLFTECLQLGQKLPDRENFGMCLVGLGSVAAAKGDGKMAARLFGAGQMILTSIQADLAPADHVIFVQGMAQAKQLIPLEVFEAEWQIGNMLSFDEAEHLALHHSPLSVS